MRDIKERFLEKLLVDQNTHCWNWIGGLDNNGYGNFRIGNKIIKAHRAAYEFFCGELIDGMDICHNCFNPSCVNPLHLRQDTRRSNALDAVNIKTSRRQLLTVHDVINIKYKLMKPYRGINAALAKEYGVSVKTISCIKTGRRWSHISIT